MTTEVRISLLKFLRFRKIIILSFCLFSFSFPLVQLLATISETTLNFFSFFFLGEVGRREVACHSSELCTSPILVLYIPNQSADGEMKTRSGSPRVASYDMMMWLCHDLMTDTTLAGLSFLRQNTKCQRQRGSEGEGVSW